MKKDKNLNDFYTKIEFHFHSRRARNDGCTQVLASRFLYSVHPLAVLVWICKKGFIGHIRRVSFLFIFLTINPTAIRILAIIMFIIASSIYLEICAKIVSLIARNYHNFCFQKAIEQKQNVRWEEKNSEKTF